MWIDEKNKRCFVNKQTGNDRVCELKLIYFIWKQGEIDDIK